VERAIEAAKQAGAKRAMLLPMSVPAHCSLMAPAAAQLEERLAGVMLSEPNVPVVHNVDVSVSGSPEAIRARLVDQVRSPVRWTECVRALCDAGITQTIECGPGRVLAGLNRRIDRQLGAQTIDNPDRLAQALNSMEVA